MTMLSLRDALKSVPDPRKHPWKCFPWHAVLMLLVFGMLVGRRGPRGFARLLDHYGADLALALGFPHDRIPNARQICVILKRIDADAFETACGSRQGKLLAIHLVSAFAAQQEAVLAQVKVGAKTNEHKLRENLAKVGHLP